MKQFLFIVLAFTSVVFYSSCDRVKFTVPKSGTSGLNWSLYPDGDSAFYVSQGLWPTFAANTNTLRNVLIEDFTGHGCQSCPNQTANMESLIATNSSRIFGLGIHSSPVGITSFQETSVELPDVLYCDEGFEIGTFFGSFPGSTFIGNPGFTVNRTFAGNQFISSAGAPLLSKTNICLTSALKVNIQATSNYFASTRGLFLHTEVDKIDPTLTNELSLVVYLVEDSLIGPQATLSTTIPNYVHREILRGCIDGKAFGKTLGVAQLNSNGKYYLNYTYKLPDQYNPDNMHLLIYVYDKTTYEIYQVIKHEI